MRSASEILAPLLNNAFPRGCTACMDHNCEHMPQYATKLEARLVLAERTLDALRAPSDTIAEAARARYVQGAATMHDAIQAAVAQAEREATDAH